MRRLIPLKWYAPGDFRYGHTRSMYRPYGGSIGAWRRSAAGKGL